MQCVVTVLIDMHLIELIFLLALRLQELSSTENYTHCAEKSWNKKMRDDPNSLLVPIQKRKYRLGIRFNLL